MRLVTAHVPNTPGILARIAQGLAEAELNIRAFSADGNRLRILTDSAPATVQALEHLGIAATEHQVLAVPLDDEPGHLAQVAKTLAEAQINIEHAFGDGSAGIVYLRVSDIDAAREALALPA